MQRTTPLGLGLAATALAGAGLLGAGLLGAGAALADEPSTPAPVTSTATPVTVPAAQPDGDGSDSDTREHMRQMMRMHELCGQMMSGQGGMMGG